VKCLQEERMMSLLLARQKALAIIILADIARSSV
jgi:hypothetical protein